MLGTHKTYNNIKLQRQSTELHHNNKYARLNAIIYHQQQQKNIIDHLTVSFFNMTAIQHK